MKHILSLLALLLSAHSALAQYTAFTYQGRLDENGVPVNGIYDLRFTIHDAGGSQIAGPVTNSPVLVSNGLFTVTLDFGASPFNGAPRWLEIAVRTNGAAGAFTILTPRQFIAPTPYALYATKAASLENLNFTGAPAFNAAGGSPFTVFSSVKVTNLNADLLDGLDSSAFWRLGGNFGVASNQSVIGPRDANRSLTILASGQPAVRILPAGAGAFSFVASHNSSIASNLLGATISGGGDHFIGQASWHATIGGGEDNVITSNSTHATISGGGFNRIETNSSFSSIGGGRNNIISSNAAYGRISGGSFNLIETNSSYASIGGGNGNRIQENAGMATLSGGLQNSIQAGAGSATIAGGRWNTNEAFIGTIGGGERNLLASNTLRSTIAGGHNHRIESSASEATIGGGSRNVIEFDGDVATVAGGRENTIQFRGTAASIGGGFGNVVGTNGWHAVVAGGLSNYAGAVSATVPGGSFNSAAEQYSFAAGRRAKANHQGAFVWADSQDADFASSAVNQFAVRAAGGVRFVTGGAGMTLDGQPVLTGGLSWSSLTGVPAGFADGIDNDTLYSAGVGLNLIGTTFSIANGGVATPQLADGSVTTAKIGDNSIDAADLHLTTFETIFWRADGNTGTTPGTHFVGTRDNRALELKANNVRALRLEPTTNNSPNVIGGSLHNLVESGVWGATIGGGGGRGSFGEFHTNRIGSSFGTIAGGYDNVIHTNSQSSTISGGARHTINPQARWSVIGGGVNHIIRSFADSSVIAGGAGNAIGTNADAATISGGEATRIGEHSDYATIGGGNYNTVGDFAPGGTIAGGTQNTIEYDSEKPTIGGGNNNFIRSFSHFATIGGGVSGLIASNSFAATLGGGDQNSLWASWATISGGKFNVAGAEEATVGGGAFNRAAGFSSTIAGGGGHVAGGAWSTVAGGRDNYALGDYSFAAGQRAKANHSGSFVWADTAASDFGSSAERQFLVRARNGVGIGSGSPAAQLYVSNSDGDAFPQAGLNQESVADYARLRFTVGSDIARRWDIAATTNRFIIYSGHYGAQMIMLDNTGLSVRGTFVSSSDRNAKENFQRVEPRPLLDKVLALPLSTWNYKDDTTTRHIGPVAQDFHASFGVGRDDKHIAMVDADGVALAAIQGLNQKLETELEARDSEIRELKKALQELREIVAEPQE
jgi:hypothetical protein